MKLGDGNFLAFFWRRQGTLNPSITKFRRNRNIATGPRFFREGRETASLLRGERGRAKKIFSGRFFQARRDPSRFSQTSSENPTGNRSSLRYQGKSRYLNLRIYDLMVTGGFAVV
jgi:hypothetical protein